MKIYLVGTGMGDGKTLTAEARRAMDEAEVFVGAERVLAAARGYDKPKYAAYKSEDVKRRLEESGAKTAAVLLSGDISFFSGAAGLSEVLSEHEAVRVPGISAYSYLCGKLGAAVSETEFVSLHGAGADYFNKRSLCNIVRDSKYTLVLLNGPDDVNSVITRLASYGLDRCVIHIGSRLGYDDEKILQTTVSCMFDARREGVAAPVSVLIENPSPRNLLGRHLRDEEFTRGGAPMTKEDVRALSLARLELERGSVLYDIGSGTGSVAVEASLFSHEIRVFAIEKKSDAYVLMNENRRKFACDNVFLINGEAPSAMEYLPAPTHVFIGGSGGRMRVIVELALKKNPRARIVINTVTLDSAAEALGVIRELRLKSEIIGVNTAKSKKIGGYNMMMGQNPIYIFTLTKEDDEVDM